MAALHHRMNQEANDANAEECVEKRCVLWNILQARRAVGELKAQYAVDVEQHDADDFAKAQRDDRQIVSLESQRRNADEDADDTRGERAEQEPDRERDAGVQPGARHEDCRRIGADRHETRVTQRELAQVSGCDVERHREDDVDADEHQDLRIILCDDAGVDEREAEDQKRYKEQRIDRITRGHRDFLICLLHLCHLILSRASGVRGGPWA